MSDARLQIRAITDALTKVMFGDFTATVQSLEPDEEWGYLCVMINVAVNAARNAHEKLQAVNAELESRVERMAESLRSETRERETTQVLLAGANEQLWSVARGLTAFLATGDWTGPADALLHGARRLTGADGGFAAVVDASGAIQPIAGPDPPADAVEAAVRDRRETRANGLVVIPVLRDDAVVGVLGLNGRFEPEPPVRERIELVVQSLGLLFDNHRRARRERELEGQLRQSQKMDAIGRLAGGVAHDFNNLLFVILGNAQLLSARAGLDPETRELLDEIAGAGRRAATLTRQLLAVSRKQILQPHTIDLGELVRGLQKMLVRLIGEDIELVAAIEPAWIHADPGQMDQVVLNLVVNARDAIRDGGRITIRTGRTDGESFLIVTDTGVGMSEEVKTHAFEPFFTTKPLGRGTGLGLSTVYGIVQQSGGRIEMASATGHGSELRVFLPAAAAPSSCAEAVAEAAAPASHGTILLVEDEKPVRALIRRILEGAGYAVLEAADGREGLDAIERGEAFDVLLTDVVMPRMSGGELVRLARAVRPDLRVLYMSGYVETRIEEGAPLVQKPASPAVLLAAVGAAMRGRADLPPRRSEL